MWAPILLIFTAFGDLSVQAACATCISDSDAQQVAQNFATLFSNYSPQYADEVIAEDFVDQTDSVSWMQSNGTNCIQPLGQISFSNREQLKAAQATQPNLPFVVSNVWHDCTNVFIRWKFAIQPQEVQGIAVLGVVPSNGQSKYPYLIQHVFSEFNTGAFIVDNGWYHGTPPPACSGKSGNSKRDADADAAAPWIHV